MNIAVMPVSHGQPHVPSTIVLCETCGATCWISKAAQATIATHYYCLDCVLAQVVGAPAGSEPILVPAEWVREDIRRLYES